MKIRKRTLIEYHAVDPDSPTIVAPSHSNRVEFRNLLKTRYRTMLIERGHNRVLIEKVTKKHVLTPEKVLTWDGWVVKNKWNWITEKVEPVEIVEII